MSRRWPRARCTALASARVAPRVQVLEATAPAARGRSGSGPAGGRWARRCPASRGRCAGACPAPWPCIVRMLCSRSASLMRMTRTSRAIASSILRKLSAWPSSRVLKCSLSSLVRPSTSSAVGAPKLLDQLGLGDAAVLDRVVHQRGHDGLGVELPVGAQAGHRHRVGDVGLAAGAELAQVGLVGELVGLAHLLEVGLGQVAQLVGQRGEGRDLGGLVGAGAGSGVRCSPCSAAGSSSAARDRMPMARI